MNTRTVLAKAAQPSTPVNFDIPAGACDCHTHIHPDPAKFPFFAGRVYTPELASPEEMTALHKALHMERVVIVTPSIYGPDNSATLFGMPASAASDSISPPVASTIRPSAGRGSRPPSNASRRADGICSFIRVLR